MPGIIMFGCADYPEIPTCVPHTSFVIFNVVSGGLALIFIACSNFCWSMLHSLNM